MGLLPPLMDWLSSVTIMRRVVCAQEEKEDKKDSDEKDGDREGATLEEALKEAEMPMTRKDKQLESPEEVRTVF